MAEPKKYRLAKRMVYDPRTKKESLTTTVSIPDAAHMSQDEFYRAVVEASKEMDEEPEPEPLLTDFVFKQKGVDLLDPSVTDIHLQGEIDFKWRFSHRLHLLVNNVRLYATVGEKRWQFLEYKKKHGKWADVWRWDVGPEQWNHDPQRWLNLMWHPVTWAYCREDRLPKDRREQPFKVKLSFVGAKNIKDEASWITIWEKEFDCIDTSRPLVYSPF